MATKAFYGEAKIQALNTAIANAQTVYDNNAATYAQVAEQITALTAAITNTAYVTTVEQFSNNAIYTFVANRNATSYMMYDGTNNFVASKWKQTSLEAGEDNANCQWAVYKSAKGNYYMYNLGAQMFMGTETAANTGIPFSETPQTTSLGFKVSAVASHPIMITPNGGSGAVNHSNSTQAGFTNNYGVINWSGGYGYVDDGGNVHKVTIVGAIDDATLAAIQEKVERYENVDIILSKAKALYETVLADNEKTVGQYTLKAIMYLANAIDIYEEYPTDENFGYVEAAYNDVLENGEKVTLKAGDKFTIKQIDTRGYVVYSAVEGMGSEENVYLAGSNRTEFHPAIDVEGVHKYWSLYEFGGKKYIYNVGNSKSISPNGSVIKFVGEPTAIEIEDLGNAESAIYLESSKNYLEASPGYNHEAVRTYGNTEGVGARFIIVKEEGTVDPTEIEQAYFNNWKEGALASLGYVGGYESSTKDEITAITTMDGFAEFVKENDKIQLTAGYYFLKGTGVGNNANWYITYGDNGTDFVAKALADGQKLGAKHVWSFDEIENENGYKLKSANLDKYATTAAAGATSQVTSNYNSGYKFVFTDNGAGKFTIKDGNGNVLRTENGGQLNHWSDETNETWYVIPAVELDITLGAEYGTIHLPFDVTLPAGLKAYAVTAVSDTYATLTEKEDIKANEGVILQGQGTHKLTIAAASSDWAENKLDGSNVNTLVESEAYVLSNGDSGLGLYKAKLNFLNGEKVEEGGTAFLNNANKAYLPVVTSGVNALRFNFDGETTAIDAVEVVKPNAPIYDLSGRRVLSTVKGGIYIQNGKKFIVK